MKDVIQFKPKEVLDVKTFKILAFACKLFFIEKWSFEQAVTMACNYYDEDNVDHIDDLFYRFACEKAFSVVSIPNRIKKKDIGKYLKDKFG